MSSHWFSAALLPDGWAESVRVVLVGGHIASVETGVAPGPGDARHGPAFPGLPNLHSHAFQRGMAGLAEGAGREGDDFWAWREAMYRFVSVLTPDMLEAIAALAYAEMLEKGFTQVGEFHYLHHAPDGQAYDNPAEFATRIAAAAAGADIGLTLLPVYYAQGGFGEPPQPRQRRFINKIDGYAALVAGCRTAIAGLDGAVLGVSPHSLRAVSPDDVRAVARLVADGPIHIHAAEQTGEVEGCLKTLGARPVEFLLDEIGIDRRWCLVHATHMTDAETQWLAASGAVAGLCPLTEANLGDGIFPAKRFAELGGRFGIGTDSNVRISAAGELELLEYGQRLTRRARAVLASGEGETGRSTGRRLLDAALDGGAQALGIAPPRLAAGGRADFVTLDAADPALALARGDGIADAWIFAGAAIDGVWRAGRQVVSKGRHRAREAIAARYAAAIASLNL